MTGRASAREPHSIAGPRPYVPDPLSRLTASKRVVPRVREGEDSMNRSRFFAAALMLAVATASATWSREASAQRCHPLANGIDVCAIHPTRVDSPDASDSTLIARLPPEVEAVLAVYFPVSPARSLAFRFDPTFKDVATGPWIEASARVSSSGVRVMDGASRAGALAPLSARIDRVVPKGAKIGNLTASAGPKDASRAIRVAVTDHGTVVWESTARSGQAIAVLPEWPSGVRTEMQAMGGLQFSWLLANSATIRVMRSTGKGDSSVTGDELRITGSSGAGMNLTQVHFRAGGADSVRISGAEVVHHTFARPRVKPRVKA